MALQYPNITLGTAGHVDHGKTALVKFLTGCDTDRLKAEKERGMSIDLGYAPCTIGSAQVGIVDVPGHESFVKTMVAGASGMDGVILVVAADDGVMPQTREHLEILTLLGVRHGVVALTKTDRVAPDALEAAPEALRSFLRGTFLADAPILPVCNLTGEGFEGFYEALDVLVRRITPKRTDGVFRLPVDRAFSARGYGTVVAGIPLSGTARLDDEVVLLPQGQAGRIKAIQVYQREADAVMAGQCAALNVRRWDHRAIRRGDTVASPGYFAAHEWYVCQMQLLPHEGLTLESGARVRFHTGTADVGAAVYLMRGHRVRAGEHCLVQVKTAEPIIAGPADRFIVRLPSPLRTIGGGMVVEAVPRRLNRNRPGLLDDLMAGAKAAADERDFVEYCVRNAQGLVVDEETLSRRAKVLPPRLLSLLGELVAQGRVVRLAPGLYAHSGPLAVASERLLSAVAEHHRHSPASPGIAATDLVQASGLAVPVLEGLLAFLKSQGKLVEVVGRLALPGYLPALSDLEQALLDAVETAFRESEFHPPDVEQVAQRLGQPLDRAKWAVGILVEHGRLVEVERPFDRAQGREPVERLLFHREAVERARGILESFLRREGRLESVKFKYLLDTTRKYAIPLLDYFDRTGLTRRVGNTRYLGIPRPARSDT
jgi:selenocysteine-specific elongation factor